MQKAFGRLLIFLLVFSFSASAQKRNLTETDLFDFAWIGDAQVSPDGSTVVFVKVAVNSAKTNYDVDQLGGDKDGSI